MTTITNKSSVSDAIQAYLNHGFGSMTKNDFEVWIFHQLLQGRLFGKSNFDISVKLQIPESKVKRLRYEASLKYGNPSDTAQYDEAFKRLLENVKLKKGSHNVVQFAVEDLQLRKYLDATLKRKGRFADTSFNTEVVSVTLDELAILLDATCTQEEKKKLMKAAKGEGAFKEVALKSLQKLVEAAVDAGASTGVQLAVNNLIDCFG